MRYGWLADGGGGGGGGRAWWYVWAGFEVYVCVAGGGGGGGGISSFQSIICLSSFIISKYNEDPPIRLVYQSKNL